MPVNDFEKQVQQKMDELQLRPSTTVWEEVEKRIRKEKKRRRGIIFWLLAAALLLGGTGWWLIDGNKKQTTNHTSVAQTGNNKKTDSQVIITNRNAEPEKSYTEKQEVKQKKIDSITRLQNYFIPANKKKEIERSAAVGELSKRIKKENVSVSSSKPDEKNIASSPDSKKEKEQNISPAAPLTDNLIYKKSAIRKDDSKKIDSAITEKGNQSAIATSNDEISINNLTDTAIAKIDKPVDTKDSTVSKKGKWEIGLTGFAGSSARADGLSIFGAEKSMDTYSQINNPSGPLTAVSATPFPTSGFSWQAGIYAKRKFKERTGVSIGLIFSVYSTKQQTGAYVDSIGAIDNNSYTASFRNIYRSGNVRTYTNHYYYLQVPFSFHWQINKGNKLPVNFHAGLAMGVLTGTNGLAYKASSNLFYKDKRSYNKLQLSFQTGLYGKFLNKTEHPITLGILYNYHISNLQKVNSYGGNHLSSFGVQLGWVLKK